MAVILRELYESVKGKEEIQLVAGEAGLEHMVRWVHMVEGIDITSFLEGDEIAFTTGIALADSSRLLELAEHTYRQQAAGMVINTGPYIREIPQEVLIFGERNGFPVFRVPWRVHMANIMREFTERIYLEEQKKREVDTAVRNAFYFPDNPGMYLPFLLRNGYKKEWSYCVSVVETCSEENGGMGGEAWSKYYRFMQAKLRNWQRDAVVMENGRELLILSVNHAGWPLQEVWDDFWQEGKKYRICGGDYFGGTGSVVETMEEIGKSFAQAEQVMHLQKRRGRKNEWLDYGKTGLYKLLLSLEGQTVLGEYDKEILGALEQYDRVNGTGLLDFLNVYFRAGCGIQETAAALHMHRNSVTYKIHKIEEILRVSLSLPLERTKIMVAFMIREIDG